MEVFEIHFIGHFCHARRQFDNSFIEKLKSQVKKRSQISERNLFILSKIPKREQIGKRRYTSNFLSNNEDEKVMKRLQEIDSQLNQDKPNLISL